MHTVETRLILRLELRCWLLLPTGNASKEEVTISVLVRNSVGCRHSVDNGFNVFSQALDPIGNLSGDCRVSFQGHPEKLAEESL
jgi:hypothetical protein